MSTGSVSKIDMLAKVYKLKNLVHDRQGKYYYFNDLQRNAADDMLNDILDILGEYSR